MNEITRVRLSIDFGRSGGAELEVRLDASPPTFRAGWGPSSSEDAIISEEVAAEFLRSLEASDPIDLLDDGHLWLDGGAVNCLITAGPTTREWTSYSPFGSRPERHHAVIASVVQVGWRSCTARGRLVLVSASAEVAPEFPTIPVLETRTHLLDCEFLWVHTEAQASAFDEWQRTLPEDVPLLFNVVRAVHAHHGGIRDLSCFAELARRAGSTTFFCLPGQLELLLKAGVPSSKVVTDKEMFALLRWPSPRSGRRR